MNNQNKLYKCGCKVVGDEIITAHGSGVLECKAWQLIKQREWIDKIT